MRRTTSRSSAGVNCVLVAGKREGEERIAACLVRADTRADVNHTVKRLLDVRKPSFMPMERAVTESEMEYGGITPVGLPSSWRLLLDAAGARRRGGRDRLRRPPLQAAAPRRLLAELPGAEVIEGLAG